MRLFKKRLERDGSEKVLSCRSTHGEVMLKKKWDNWSRRMESEDMIQRSQQRQEEELVKREKCFVRKEEGNTPFSLRARMEGSGWCEWAQCNFSRVQTCTLEWIF